MARFELPDSIKDLVRARNALRERYRSSGLRFTLDGNLVGDIGEAIAAELFGLRLTARNGTGVDGHAPDGRTVQVKASGTNRGPAFRNVDTRAEHLIFLSLDFESCSGAVIFNGPERIAVECLPAEWSGQRMLSLSRIRNCDERVRPEDRLPALGGQKVKAAAL